MVMIGLGIKKRTPAKGENRDNGMKIWFSIFTKWNWTKKHLHQPFAMRTCEQHVPKNNDMFEHVPWNFWPLKNSADRPEQTWRCACRPLVVFLEKTWVHATCLPDPATHAREVSQLNISPVQIAFGKAGAVNKRCATCFFFVSVCFVSLLQGAQCQWFWGHLCKHCYVSWNVLWVIAGSLQMIFVLRGPDVMNWSMQVHLAITNWFIV